MRSSRFKFLFLLLAIGLLASGAWLRKKTERINEVSKLNLRTSVEDAPPPELTVAMSLGVFRSVLINILWYRAASLQHEKKFYELVQLYDMVGKLQPYNGKIWSHIAWNMAYNISVEMPPGMERWRWIENGLNRIRDYGLRYNPDSRYLYKELSWIFSHKIGNTLDDSHLLYKTLLAEKMMNIFGAEVFTAKAVLKELESGEPEIRAKARAIEDRLMSEMKMKLKDMAEMEEDDRFGPLDWRLPQVHGMYWAHQGLKKPEREVDDIDLQRLLYQPMNMLLRQGTLVYLPATGKSKSTVSQWPDYRQVWPIQKMFVQQINFTRDKKADMRGVTSAYGHFLNEAIEILIFAGQDQDAEKLYRKANTEIPGVIAAPSARDQYDVESKKRIKRMNAQQLDALMSSTMMQYYWWLAMGDVKRSNKLLNQSKRIYSNIREAAVKNKVRGINQMNFETYSASILTSILEKKMFHPNVLERLKLHPVTERIMDKLSRDKAKSSSTD